MEKIKKDKHQIAGENLLLILWMTDWLVPASNQILEENRAEDYLEKDHEKI